MTFPWKASKQRITIRIFKKQKNKNKNYYLQYDGNIHYFTTYLYLSTSVTAVDALDFSSLSCD